MSVEVRETACELRFGICPRKNTTEISINKNINKFQR